MKAAATAVERRNEVAELDRCFFISSPIKSRAINIAVAILVVKRLRYDRARFIVGCWPDLAPPYETHDFAPLFKLRRLRRAGREARSGTNC